MKCKCLGRYATWVCRAVLAGSLLMAPMVTENFVAASNASTSVTTTDEADAILKEAKAIVAQPGTFYTLYVGMPNSDLRANFDNLPGWEVRSWIDNDTAERRYVRTLPVGKKRVEQGVIIRQINNGPVYQFMNIFTTTDKVTAAKIYREMYTVLKERYPVIEVDMPYRMTTNHHYTPSVQIKPGVYMQLLFYKSLRPTKGPAEYEVYYMIVGARSHYVY